MTAGDVDITNSIESEMLTSFLDGAGTSDGPKTSTPVKGKRFAIGVYSSSSDEMDSKAESIESVTDSGSVTAPNFSLLTCSDLSSVAPQHEDRFEGQSLEVTTASDHLSQHICLSPGYKIVMDNIDKNVRPREMRLDSQTESLHYMHMYGVRDRVNFSGLSNMPKNNDISIYDILPTAEDYAQLKHNLSILLAHTMTDHLFFFGEEFQGLVENHIPHPYSSVMSLKSEVVSIPNN